MRMINLNSQVTRRCRTQLVSVVPNSDTDISGNSHTSLDDGHESALCCSRSPSVARSSIRSSSSVHGNLKTKSSDPLHVGKELVGEISPRMR